jgi:NADH-quinone oxidoreductase subunit H
MISVSCLATILFFGGWLSPFPDSWTFTHYLPSLLLIPGGLYVIYDGMKYEHVLGKIQLSVIGLVITLIGVALLVPQLHEVIQGPFWFFAKVFIFLFVYIWMRATLPRFRYDQLMAFGWKFLLPVSIANVVITSVVILWRTRS